LQHFGHFFWLHHTVEPVTAEQQEIPGLEFRRSDVGLDGGQRPHGLQQHVLEGRVQQCFAFGFAHRIQNRLVVGDLGNLALAQQIRSRVAHLPDNGG
jgi:hypothetical protein